MRRAGLNRRAWAAAALALTTVGCDARSPAGPGEEGPEVTVVVVDGDLHMRPGGILRLAARDGADTDVTEAATWRASDAETVTLDAGLVSAELPGVTWISADYGDAADSVRVVVSFPTLLEVGVALDVRGVLSSALELTGSALWHDRLGSDRDHTMLMATPGTFDPETPPGIDFAGDGTQISLSFSSAPTVGVRQLESWTVIPREAGGFAFEGPDGVVVWYQDPLDPDRVELYVSVGLFDLEVDRVEPAPDAGLPSGVLAGRVAFDGAGLEVDLSQGPPRIVGQLDTETVRVFAEFQLALRAFPIGTGTIEVEGGPAPFAVVPVGAPQAGRYLDGVILDYSLALPDAEGATVGFANQIWIGTPRVGLIDLEAVGPEAIAGTEAYSADRAWAWSAHGTDIQAVFRGDGATNAFSSGGSVRVTSYRPASDDVFGQIEGDFEIPETLHGPQGVQGAQVVRGTFVAPVLPHALAAAQIVPPPEIPTPETPEPEPWRPRIGDGSARIYGRVIEDDVLPVEGVEIRISGPAGSGTAVSNSLGAYAFEGLTPGDYHIELAALAGHQLARGQAASIPGVHVEDRDQRVLELHLADAAGNGTLFVIAANLDAQTLVDGVGVTVRPEDGGDPVATLVTGSERLGGASVKLQPGRYRLEVEAPPGLVLSPSEVQPMVVQIVTGHQWFEVVGLVAG
jgi:hypothetical protein